MKSPVPRTYLDAGQRGRGGVRGHLEDRREPVHGAGEGAKHDGIAAEGAEEGAGEAGPAGAHEKFAKRARSVSRERLGAVVVAAGERVVGLLGGIVRVGAGLVLVVGLVVPGPVVEILVLVGGLGAVEPVDGHARAGGAGVVAGVDGGGAADHPEARAVGPDVGVAGRGEVLDEGVVVRDIGGRGVALGGGEEQQPERVAGGQAGGLEAPVRGDRVDGAGLGRAVDPDLARPGAADSESCGGIMGTSGNLIPDSPARGGGAVLVAGIKLGPTCPGGTALGEDAVGGGRSERGVWGRRVRLMPLR